MKFNAIIKRIESGNTVHQSILLPFLCKESKNERQHINYLLAKACLQAGDFSQAKVFIDRAWWFSGFSDTVLPVYKAICEKLHDFESLREAYKRHGISCANAGKIGEALTAFNSWQYTIALNCHLDSYSYDMDILESVERLSEPYRYFEYSEDQRLSGSKIRLAYLVFGASHVNSVLLKILKSFAKHHDKSIFEVAFFVPESESTLIQSNNNKEELSTFFSAHGTSVYFGKHNTLEESLFSCAQQIHDYNADILITSAALADFEHLFIASLRPAPIVVGLVQGPPQQFVSPFFDHAISWSKHPLIDSPLNTSFVKLGVELPDPNSIITPDRNQFGIPEHHIIMMSCGRYVKFQDHRFWQLIFSALSQHPNSCFVVVGAERKQIKCLSEFETEACNSRIIFLGWRTDCNNLISMADILIDTYPSGGGHVLIDAMSLGVPFISFENNYLKIFDQTDWSVADEFVDIPELMIPRTDSQAFIDLISRLIKDAKYRAQMGIYCSKAVRNSLPDPEAGVRSLEKTYLHIKRASKHAIVNSNKDPFKKSIKRKTSIKKQTLDLKWRLTNYLRYYIRACVNYFK